jgi:hypothetical protein
MVKDFASQYIFSIEEGIFFPDASGPCTYCPYGDICRYGTKGMNRIRREKTR